MNTGVNASLRIKSNKLFCFVSEMYCKYLGSLLKIRPAYTWEKVSHLEFLQMCFCLQMAVACKMDFFLC